MFIDNCLKTRDYQTLYNSFLNKSYSTSGTINDYGKHVFEMLRAYLPLTKIYSNVDFPKNNTFFELGGGGDETIGFTGIQFIKNDNRWSIHNIVQYK